MEQRFLKTGEVAQKIGVSQVTLRNMEKTGVLVPHHVDDSSGYRYYTKEQILDYLNKNQTKKVIGFTRTPTLREAGKEAMDLQVYLLANGEPFEIICEAESDEQPSRGLKSLLASIILGQASKVVVKNRKVLQDRPWLEYIAELKDCYIEVMDSSEEG